MAAYYNEPDAFMAAWLRALITAGELPEGEVDERSIADVRAADLRGFRHCHFFAGIGGWALALRLAEWPGDRECWTGSCPCQPFSTAGTKLGGDDPRDLWPTWFQLIEQCRPAAIFGEQTEGALAHGWLDRVCVDLERARYAVGAATLPAACVGAHHVRQRVWFVAEQLDAAAAARALDFSASGRRPRERDPSAHGIALQASPWHRAEWLRCADGTARAIEPESFPLAHGVPDRVGRLRGYGNAVVPQLAAEVIAAYLEG